MTSVLNPRLRKLLEDGELDWDDFRQRSAFLKYWINRPLVEQEEEPADEPG
jgi:hypothetical protein